MVKKVEMIPAENKLLVKRATSFRVRNNSRTDGSSIFVTYLLCTVGRRIAPRDVKEKKNVFFSNSLGTVLQGIAYTGDRFFNINYTTG
jgi:hypothetical protein